MNQNQRNDKRRAPLIDRTRAPWFAEQILPHEPALRRWLSSRCGVLRLEVDDIIQESYAVLAAKDSVDDILNPRAYLFQVAHSLVLRDIRRARIVPILAMEDLGPVEFVDHSVSPEQAAEDRDMLRHVARVIESLPERTREAFSLRRIHGVRQQEIAQRMGISEKVVEKHIARGIRRLSEWLVSGGERSAQASMPIESGDELP